MSERPEPFAQLLAIDLDFTLLDADRNIPSENRAAVRRARAAGIHVVLASGRIASGMRHYSDQLGLDGPLISCNGAYVVTAGREIIEEHRFSRRYSQRVIRYCRSHGFHVNVYADDKVYFAETSPWTDIYLRRAQRANAEVVGWDALMEIDPLKVILIDSRETVARLQVRFQREFRAQELSVTVSEPEYLEFLSPDCSKGTGLAAVAGILGVPRERTAAVGDYHNDLPMLEWAGHSAAVANAPEAVRAAADVLVPRHDRGGVAAYVDLVLQNLEQS
ncbi:MAG: HAD family phosphatase [Armatimonadetes bacterium]|nr:HAD family phosphatase [Armatimonadota bacterium]